MLLKDYPSWSNSVQHANRQGLRWQKQRLANVPAAMPVRQPSEGPANREPSAMWVAPISSGGSVAINASGTATRLQPHNVEQRSCEAAPWQTTFNVAIDEQMSMRGSTWPSTVSADALRLCDAPNPALPNTSGNLVEADLTIMVSRKAWAAAFASGGDDGYVSTA